MSTPLTDAIEALTTYANETTGASDTTLSDAVGTLIDGYGGGSANDNFASFLANTLTTLNDPNITKINNMRGLSVCTSLQYVTLPNCTYISHYCFSGDTGLLEVFMPSLTNGYDTGFYFEGCSSLKKVSLPAFNNILRNNAFVNCRSLEIADIGEPTNIYPGVFSNCSSLSVVILRKTSAITSLYNVNAFNGTPFASGGSGGTIYCPSALIDTYKSATNWSTLNGYGTVTWVAIENSPYESTTWIND